MKLKDIENAKNILTYWECNCSIYDKQTVIALDDLEYLPDAEVDNNKAIGHWAHGHWENSNFCYKCSVCHKDALHSQYNWAEQGIYPFCPNCGVKMEEVTEYKR